MYEVILEGGEYSPFLSRESGFQGGSGLCRLQVGESGGRKWPQLSHSKPRKLIEMPHWGNLPSHRLSGIKRCECALWTAPERLGGKLLYVLCSRMGRMVALNRQRLEMVTNF